MMKKVILLLQFVLLLSFSGFAHGKSDGESTKVIIEDARSSIEPPMMEIVHYHDEACYYRINKETGEVLLLLDGKAYVLDIEKSTNNIIYEGKVNFQLIAGNNVYLMNVNTGETWYLKSNRLFTYSDSRFVLMEYNNH